MIIVSMGCGLGNQMFEYAFIYAMMYQYPDIKIKIDNKYMLPIEHNGYELEKVFGIHLEECTKKEVKKLAEYCNVNSKFNFFHRLKNKIRRKIGINKNTYFFQKDYTKYYNEVFQLDMKESYYLHGVWANYKYFESVKDEILEQFVFRGKINESTNIYRKKIMENTSVSIHLRRGDYKNNSNLILGLDYYKKAIKIMEEKVSDIYWYVFSDELDIAKSLFCKRDNVIYVEGNRKEDSWMDMYLMSLCKHNIIANSSFSFWGAILNRNPDKIVIASKKPFDKCEVPFTVDGWISI